MSSGAKKAVKMDARYRFLARLILGLFIVFAVWLVSGTLAAAAGIPNLAAKEAGLDCLCSPVLVTLFGYYAKVGGLEVNLSFLVPALLFGMLLLLLYASRKEAFQARIKQTVAISLLISIIGIVGVVSTAYVGGELSPYIQTPKPLHLQIEFELLNGEVVTLADFRGKPLLLELMSPWCKYCSMEVNELRKITEKYGGALNVLSVCADSRATVKDVAIFNEAHGVSWQTGIDPTGRLMDAFGAPGYPYLVLLDKEGNVVKVFKGLTKAETIEAYADEVVSR